MGTLMYKFQKNNQGVCTTRFLLTWMCLTISASFLFALIVFVSLAQKDVLPLDLGGETIPLFNIPAVYNVYLSFNLTNDKPNQFYEGSVKVDFTANQISQRIYVHRGSDHKISNIKLDLENKGNLPIRMGLFNDKTEIQSFVPNHNLTLNGRYTFRFNFTAKLSSSPGGPRMYTYDDVDNNKRYGMSFISKRSATKGLRYLFPCMDSRDFPALYNLHVRHDNSLTVLSNYPVNETTRSSNLTVDLIPAQTRLYPNQLGLILTEFPKEEHQFDNITISVYSRPTALTSIPIRRIRQFMDKSASKIGKMDAVILPDCDTVNQPGLSVLNELETAIEQKEIELAETIT